MNIVRQFRLVPKDRDNKRRIGTFLCISLIFFFFKKLKISLTKYIAGLPFDSFTTSQQAKKKMVHSFPSYGDSAVIKTSG